MMELQRNTHERLNNRLNMPPAMFRAIPLEYMALEARFDAWLNLSQREKATVFVMVRMSAMTVGKVVSGCSVAKFLPSLYAPF